MNAGSRKSWGIGLLVVGIVVIALYNFHLVWLHQITGNPLWLTWAYMLGFMIPLYVGMMLVKPFLKKG